MSDEKRKVSAEETKDWDKWLSEYEAYLKSLGYGKYVQHHKNEDFAYWKTFSVGEDKVYQTGILFYDFRKYADRDPFANRIATQFECMLLGESRIDLSVSKDINLSEFESMAKTFYASMKEYTQLGGRTDTGTSPTNQ
jgi:hypothetical protein